MNVTIIIIKQGIHGHQTLPCAKLLTSRSSRPRNAIWPIMAKCWYP